MESKAQVSSISMEESSFEIPIELITEILSRLPVKSLLRFRINNLFNHLANTLIISNLAIILSGIEKIGGYMAILKACFLIRGRTATSLSLALIVNLALAGVEALFQYRIVRAYHHKRTRLSSIALEGMFIAYLYSILLVLDTISSCVFLKIYKTDCQRDEEGSFPYQIAIEDRDSHAVLRIKTLEEL
ncbi:PREDICTED: uncharacterized protein LOC109217687 isoform X2 [Nicotiana attenuata]|uniref:uncharacterized protein LOC109217687 isoform X2 n=1 Tax=Nicotiana attenuata TaxID=49451 RepID=UPI000905848F|nr:PREDICTED: uncharacterized protein LOC109217687 isoform X2 [Nicotiana attenuata]